MSTEVLPPAYLSGGISHIARQQTPVLSEISIPQRFQGALSSTQGRGSPAALEMNHRPNPEDSPLEAHESAADTEDSITSRRLDLQEKNTRLQLLLELNNRMMSHPNLPDLLTTISSSVCQIAQCDVVAFHLPDLENLQMQLCALDVPDWDPLLTKDAPESFDSCESPYGREVFRSSKPVLIEAKLSKHECANQKCIYRGSDTETRTPSICAVPIVRRGKTLGVLELIRRRNSEFTPAEVEFLSQVASQIAIAIENALAFREIKDLKNQLAREKIYLEDELRSEQGFEEIIGRSAAIRAVLRKIETVAPTDSTVLICGETGTGKELIARAIHKLSARHDNAFVKLNCAAIPTGLLESELFGHERGAFTGAIMQRIGRFELSNRGTAFLDEIGEIALELQPKLLRVLQEREFERLGSSRTIKTDARLIAATNRDLALCVSQHTFRADLFYRLNVFPIHVPPLRERPEDIPTLVRHFVMFYARRISRSIDTIPSDTMEALVRHSWPGNIRELQNLIEHSVILSSGPTLCVPLANLDSTNSPRRESSKPRTLCEAEREHILATLKETKWIVAGARGAAARLGMNRSTLQFRMKKLGILRPGSE